MCNTVVCSGMNWIDTRDCDGILGLLVTETKGTLLQVLVEQAAVVGNTDIGFHIASTMTRMDSNMFKCSLTSLVKASGALYLRICTRIKESGRLLIFL